MIDVTKGAFNTSNQREREENDDHKNGSISKNMKNLWVSLMSIVKDSKTMMPM